LSAKALGGLPDSVGIGDFGGGGNVDVAVTNNIRAAMQYQHPDLEHI
jgi:hypothetical protein